MKDWNVEKMKNFPMKTVIYRMCNENDRYLYCLHAPFVNITNNRWQTNLSSVQPQAFFNVFLFWVLHFDPTESDRKKISQFDTKTVHIEKCSISKHILLFRLTYLTPLGQDIQCSTINWHIRSTHYARIHTFLTKKSHTIKSFSFLHFCRIAPHFVCVCRIRTAYVCRVEVAHMRNSVKRGKQSINSA